MATIRSVLRSIQRPLWILLFLCGVAVPITLLFVTTSRDDVNQPVEAKLQINSRSHERKPLDYADSRDTSDVLKYQIQEMKQIKVSVQNELRQLEKERSDLYKDVRTNKDSLASIRKQISIAKADLQEARSKLPKTQHEDHSREGFPPVVVNPAPIVLVNVPPPEKSMNVNRPRIHSANRVCTFEDCFDYSRCPLTNEFNVYVYNQHPQKGSLFESSDLINKVITGVSNRHYITDEPKDACVFLAILGPHRTIEANLQESLEALPHWENDGANHIILDFHSGDASMVGKQPTSRAIYASVFLYRENYDISIVPALKESSLHIWKGLPPHLPAFRTTLLYFEGEMTGGDGELSKNDAFVRESDIVSIRDSILAKTTDKIYISTKCLRQSQQIDSNQLGEWKLCGNSKDRSSNLSKSTFTLILGSKTGVTGLTTGTRLIEALQFGSIPVLLGVKYLPFDSVIDWDRATVTIPAPRIGHLHYILRTISHDAVLEFRRQGRFLWETYFSSTNSIVNTILAIVRQNAYHSPPAAKEYTDAKPLCTISGRSKQIEIQTHQQDLTVYSTEFWNSPPGPSYMYHSTPFTPGPVSGSQYEGLTSDQVTRLPEHVIKAGGITGPFFRDYLLGNLPAEKFTVVMLTYERNQVLVEAIKRLDDLDGLAKVVVMWNSPNVPPSDMEWPTIAVPVEVVSVGRNSLNNRFLPLANIQTEAVLSLDDDVHLRADEIEFAFRVWREARDRIVGFPGRFHAWDVRHNSWLYNSNYTCELSMVLTGAAFLHKYYLYLYSQWMPEAVRDIVDEYMNCEDIAMNFLVSHITRKPPLKVTSRWTFRCPGCPENLSSNDEHFNERHICMNRFVEVYGYMPLLYTQFRLDSVLFKTRLPSHLEKCYQYV